MEQENVWTHLIIAVIATIPAILAGVASVLVSLRQLKKANQTHTVVNGRVDQLVAMAEEKGRFEERWKLLQLQGRKDLPTDECPLDKESK